MMLSWSSRHVREVSKGVEMLSKEFMIILPEDYLSIVREYDGGRPSAEEFNDKEGDEKAFGNLLRVSDSSVIEEYICILDRLPNLRLIPFADTPGGDNICFDYRGRFYDPKIVYWDHERAHEDVSQGITEVANSFSEFLKLLY